MKLQLGFSSCPNDTLIFEALVNKRIDTRGLDFEIHIADVEELNQRALQGDLDITKLSFFAIAQVLNHYQILDTGSALGFANGPLFICKDSQKYEITPDKPIAIPGEHTTAHLLFSLAYPEFHNKQFRIFSDIEAAIAHGDVAAGVIIHENRFTYAQRGFHALCDLGAFWEERYNLPIPLGGIVVKKSLPNEVKQTVNQLIGESIRYGKAHIVQALPYIQSLAQEMHAEVMQKHINLFVNDFSSNLGTLGKEAIRTLFTAAKEKNMLRGEILNDMFLNG
ncbi:MAG: 1,4-dihydroxy-6-naphthoate synthase [Bacteroidales bacterium]|jgi:1,4-dihydroxy-6-naphthoate synthase|nr:1,4-dihydroxy-6-naphthoate synthase [Bacteroidales bacterium]